MQDIANSLAESIKPLLRVMHDFEQYGRSVSDTFCFWDNYVKDYSQLLLDYVSATRDGKRDIELEAFAEMLPLDFMCGHTNYARFGCIHVSEGRLLKTSHPEIYDAIRLFITQRIPLVEFGTIWQSNNH